MSRDGTSSALTLVLRRLFAIDLRSLAAFRILLGLTTLLCLAVVFPDAEAFYSDAGVLPRADLAGRISPWNLSLLHLTGEAAFAQALIVCNALAAMALVLGWRSRASAAICWVLFLSLAHRNDLITQGGDLLLSLMLFWAMFLPVGAIFSIDSALSPAPPISMSHLSAASVGVLLQAAYVYVFGALLKTGPEWIPYGSAIYMALHLESIATPFAHVMRQFPDVLFVLTYFVWSIEIASPALLFFPDRALLVRKTTLVLLAAMHLGFRMCLNIGHFWLASLASLIPFIPGDMWDRLERVYWRPEQRRIALYYDSGCGFCRKTCLILRTFFLPRDVQIAPAQGDPRYADMLLRENSWVVVDAAGRVRLHWDALTFVVSQSPALAPIGWLSRLYGAIGLGRPTYDFIGRSRKVLGGVTGVLLRERQIDTRLSGPVQIALTVVALFAFVWNVQGAFRKPGEMDWFPAPVVHAGRALGQTQLWTMFAPYPKAVSVWPIVEGRTNDGQAVDVFHDRPQAPNRLEPDYISLDYSSIRWRSFFDRTSSYTSSRRLQVFSRYAAFQCRIWARRARTDPGGALQTASISLVHRQTLSNYQTRRRVEQVGHWRCEAR